MVAMRGGFGSGSGSGSGAGQLDEQLREFISSDITRNILEKTLVIFGTIKEGIMEVLAECLGSFRSDMVVMMGPRNLIFHEFQTCGAAEFFWKKDPIVSRRWLTDVTYAFRTSSCPDGVKVILVCCLLKDRA